MITETPCEILGSEWSWETEDPDYEYQQPIIRLMFNGELYVGRVPSTCRVFGYSYWQKLHGYELTPERVEGTIEEVKRIIEMRVATGVY